MFDYKISQKITLLNITINLIRKILNFSEVVKPTVAGTSFLKFSFSLENSNFIIGNNTAGCFLWSNRLLLCSFLRKHLPNTQCWITIVCLIVLLSRNNEVPWKKSSQFSLQFIHTSFTLSHPLFFGKQQRIQNPVPILSQRILKRHGLAVLIKLIILLLHQEHFFYELQGPLPWFLLRCHPPLLLHNQCKSQHSEKRQITFLALL